VVKYTREVLAAAAADSRSIAEVLRRLGVRWSGGAHAHISRRLKSFDIDTTHFTGRPATPVHRGRFPLTPAEILVVRAADARRARPELLRRALVEAGVAYLCAACGTGNAWNGGRLVLQVDHIDGNPADCRVTNLRFLCPNCHSQTGTYAGRNRRVFATSGQVPVTPPGPRSSPARTADEVAAVIAQVDRGALTVVAAAARIGCSRSHFYRVRRHLQETGSVEPRVQARQRRLTERHQAIVAQALENPDLGPKKIAQLLRSPSAGGWRVSPGTVSNVLAAAGLGTRAARRVASGAAGDTPASGGSL
jgi:transposase